MLSLLLLSIVVAQPEPAPKSPLEAPKTWSGETIVLPPSFAPKLGLKGWEHIRFAPEMFDESSDRFFSYAVLFDVEKIKLDEKKLGDEILVYYRGLAKAVSQGEIDTKPFQLEWLDPEKVKVGDEAANDKEAKKKGVQVRRCKLEWVEPFRTKKKQTLLIETHTWDVDKQTRIFFCVSTADWDDEVWKDLRKIRETYRAK